MHPINSVWRTALCLIACVSATWGEPAAPQDDPWFNPPPEARLRAYWWWLNGNVDKPAITRDLEQMKEKGFGGAVIFDADGSSQQGHQRAPAGPKFGSPAWCELFSHTTREAGRLGMELSLNIQSGWNLGGPGVKAEDAVKRITWSESIVEGNQEISLKLDAPPVTAGFYRDIVTLALPSNAKPHPSVFDWRARALHEKLKPAPGTSWVDASSAPPTGALLTLDNGPRDDRDAHKQEVVDVSKFVNKEGLLRWKAPAGKWKILRFGMTLGGTNQVSTSSEGWGGYALDPLDEGALNRYWDSVVEPILAAAGTEMGKSLKYVHTDSWEVETFNWTPALMEEFRKRRGYDMTPWMPVLTGNIIESRLLSQRFLNDFRLTLGDLGVDHYMGILAARAAKHGLGIHPEAGGPHYTPIDAQRMLGQCTIPMSEFWAEAATHRVSDASRFFIKQPASAAHTYGKNLVSAEGFTSVGPHWQETLWDNLKPSFDMACTEGMNRLVWHAFVCSPEKMGVPGQQYFAGTHLNPNNTWWERSAPFFLFLNRCQWMLQRGSFRADALVYYGDHVPNFTQSRVSDPARLGSGYDYDVITAEALITRVKVKDGLLVMPDGMSYRLLTLPDQPSCSVAVLRKVKELVQAGATVLGKRPVVPSSLEGYPQTDAEFTALCDFIWSGNTGKGRVISDKTAREVLEADGIGPDFRWTGDSKPENIRYIHRTAGESDIYYVTSRTKAPVSVLMDFRIAGRTPELWNPVTGERAPAAAFSEKDGRTLVPIDFSACGSIFVVFRKPSSGQSGSAQGNSPKWRPLSEISGPWQVSFDQKFGGPSGGIVFPELSDWSKNADPKIRFYSGTAIYRKSFTVSTTAKRVVLDLGLAREIATVRLNGRELGTLWAPPFQVDATSALRNGENELEVEVVNFWPNRIIGDSALPESERVTRTNIRTLKPESPLMVSGLLGPVRLLEKLPE